MFAIAQCPFAAERPASPSAVDSPEGLAPRGRESGAGPRTLDSPDASLFDLASFLARNSSAGASYAYMFHSGGSDAAGAASASASPSPRPAPLLAYKMDGLHPSDLRPGDRAEIVASLCRLVQARRGQGGSPGGRIAAAVGIRSGCISLQVGAFSAPDGPEGGRVRRVSDTELTWDDIVSALPPELREKARRPAPPSEPLPSFHVLPSPGAAADDWPTMHSYPIVSTDPVTDELVVRLRVAVRVPLPPADVASPSAPSGPAYFYQRWTLAVWLGSDSERLPLVSERWMETDGGDSDGDGTPPPVGTTQVAAITEARLRLPPGAVSPFSYASRVVVQLCQRDGGLGPAVTVSQAALLLPAAAAQELATMMPATADGVLGDMMSVLELVESAEAMRAANPSAYTASAEDGAAQRPPILLPPQVHQCLDHLVPWAMGQLCPYLAAVAAELQARADEAEEVLPLEMDLAGGPWGPAAAPEHEEREDPVAAPAPPPDASLEDLLHPWSLQFAESDIESAYLTAANAHAPARMSAFSIFCYLGTALPLISSGRASLHLLLLRPLIPAVALWAFLLAWLSRRGRNSIQARLWLVLLLLMPSILIQPEGSLAQCAKIARDQWPPLSVAAVTLCGSTVAGLLPVLTGAPFLWLCAAQAAFISGNLYGQLFTAHTECGAGPVWPYQVAMLCIYPSVCLLSLLWVRRKERVARAGFLQRNPQLQARALLEKLEGERRRTGKAKDL